MPPPSTAFLLANWYSGATLLTLLLDRHPRVLSNGEGFYHPFPQPDITCSCGVNIRSCEFYRDAAAGMWAGNDYDEQLFRLTPALFKHQPFRGLADSTRFAGKWRREVIRSIPGVRSRYDRFVQAHIEFMTRALKVAQARLYLDGTKSLRRAEIFLSEPGFRSSPILLLVRNPLSWCASWMDKHDNRGETGLSVAAHKWNEYVRRAFLLEKRFPASRFRVLRYEDLCNYPDRELAAVEDWLGLKSQRVLTGSRRTPHILGNRMRFRFDGIVRPPTDRSRQLSREQQQEIVRRCRGWMQEVGYCVPTDLIA